MQPQILEQYLNRYLKSYQSPYKSHNMRHVVATEKLFSYMPFRKLGGVIADPNLKFAIVYTDAEDIREWIQAHQEHVVAQWHNDNTVDHVSFAGGGHGLRKRGRPSVEEAELIRQQQWEMTRHVIEQTAAGKSGKQIALELGISPSRVSQLKKRYESNYFVDMMSEV